MRLTHSASPVRRILLGASLAALAGTLILAPVPLRRAAQSASANSFIAPAAGAPVQSGATVNEYTIPTANSGSSNITAGPDGNLWFTETNGNKIGQVTTDGLFNEFPIPTANSQPYGIGPGPDGNLWFTEQGTNKVGRIALDGTITEFSIPTANSQPFGIASGSDNALWFTENAANKIGRITTSGAVTEFAVPTAGSGPLFITQGWDGNMWFTERAASKIGSITPAGVIGEFATPTPNSGPEGITASFDGNIWFTEKPVDKIGVATTSGSITEIPLFAGSDPARIAAATDGSVLVTEQAPNKFLKITPSGAVSSITPSDIFTFEETLLPPGGGLNGVGSGENQTGGIFTLIAAGVETLKNSVAVAQKRIIGQFELTKTASPDPVDGGRSITYTITVKNHTKLVIEYSLLDVELGQQRHLVPISDRMVTNPGWELLKIPRNDGSTLPAFEQPGFDTINPGEEKHYALKWDTLSIGGTATNFVAAHIDVLKESIGAQVSSTINATPGPDFSLGSPTPSTPQVSSGGTTSITINTQSASNPQARGITPEAAINVNFTASVAPASSSITTSFSPNPVTVPGSTTLTVGTASSTPVGTYAITITGAAGSVTRTTGVTLVVQAPPPSDFSIGFDSPTVTAQAGTKARVNANINRTGGFAGNVTVTPPPAANGIRPKPADPITAAPTDTSVAFKFKIGGGVTPGQYPLTFTAQDDSGRTRTGTVTLVVQ